MAEDSQPDRQRGATVSQRLEQALLASAAANALRHQDHPALLEAVVSTAVRVIDATAGSLLLLDHEAGELEFAVAVGPGADEIKRFRVPMGQGVAGFSASTGQALAIADTSQDTRFARQIAEGSGYVPHNLLCIPLILRGEVIGVMELLDKNGGQSAFTPADTAVLAAFGEQAAMAIDLSLHAQSLERLLAAAAAGGEELQADIAAVVAAAAQGPGYDRTIELAGKVAGIAAAGERQTRLCVAVLNAVLDFAAGDFSNGMVFSSNMFSGSIT